MNFLNSSGNQIEGKVKWIKIEDNEYCGISEKDKFYVKPDYENRPVVYVTWAGAASIL